jgi:hypothetical protein
MNGQRSQMADLECALRALAEEDCHVQAPPHVQASVMQTGMRYCRAASSDTDEVPAAAPSF